MNYKTIAATQVDHRPEDALFFAGPVRATTLIKDRCMSSEPKPLRNEVGAMHVVLPVGRFLHATGLPHPNRNRWRNCRSDIQVRFHPSTNQNRVLIVSGFA